jgi:hypothetical protein
MFTAFDWVARTLPQGPRENQCGTNDEAPPRDRVAALRIVDDG